MRKRAVIELMPHEIAFNLVLASIALRYFRIEGGASISAWVYCVLILVFIGILAVNIARPGRLTDTIRLGWFPVAMSLVFNYMRGRIGIIAGPPLDAQFIAIDARIFGITPSVFFERVENIWLGEALSAAYFMFFIYLYGSSIAKLCGDLLLAKRFYSGLFTLYAAGFLGYSFFPAIGPYLAATDLFQGPIDNGPIAQAVLDVVLRGTNGADIFPSLHVAVTLYILLFDRSAAPQLFRVALVPACMLFVATLYLRFHYGVDVIAGALLAVACLGVRDLRFTFRVRVRGAAKPAGA
jgi:hypothetical protein